MKLPWLTPSVTLAFPLPTALNGTLNITPSPSAAEAPLLIKSAKPKLPFAAFAAAALELQALTAISFFPLLVYFTAVLASNSSILAKSVSSL